MPRFLGAVIKRTILKKATNPMEEKETLDWSETESWADDFVYVVKSLLGPAITIMSLVGGPYLLMTGKIPEEHQDFIETLILVGVGGGSATSLQPSRNLQRIRALQGVPVLPTATPPNQGGQEEAVASTPSDTSVPFLEDEI